MLCAGALILPSLCMRSALFCAAAIGAALMKQEPAQLAQRFAPRFPSPSRARVSAAPTKSPTSPTPSPDEVEEDEFIKNYQRVPRAVLRPRSAASQQQQQQQRSADTGDGKQAKPTRKQQSAADAFAAKQQSFAEAKEEGKLEAEFEVSTAAVFLGWALF